MCKSVNVNSVVGNSNFKVMEDKGMFKFDINMKVFGEKYDDNGKFWFEDLVSREDKISYVGSRLQTLVDLGNKFLSDKASLVKPDGSFKTTVLAKWLRANDVHYIIEDKSADKLTYSLFGEYIQGSLLDYPNIKSASPWSVYDNVDVVDACFNTALWKRCILEQKAQMGICGGYDLGYLLDGDWDYDFYKSRTIIGICPNTSCMLTLSIDVDEATVLDYNNSTYVKVLSQEDINNLIAMMEPAKNLRNKIQEFRGTSGLGSLDGTGAAEKATVLDNKIKLEDMKSELERMIAHIYRDFGKSIGLL